METEILGVLVLRPKGWNGNQGSLQFFEEIQGKAQRNNRAKQCDEHGTKSRKAASVHCRLGELLWNGRHEGYGQGVGRVAPKKDQDVLLETMEESPHEARQPCETRHRETESVGICQHKKELLAYSQ